MLKKVFISMEEEVKTIKAVAEHLKTAFTRVEEGLNSIKKRQDLVFLKQDQIQSTLAGEFPPPKHLSSRSPSVTPSVAWSTQFSSPPLLQTEHPNMIPMTKRSYISSPRPPMLTSPTDTDFLSDEDVQSFFSVDWGEEMRDGRTSHCEYPSVADHSKDETQLPVSVSIQTSGNPLSIAQQTPCSLYVVNAAVTTGTSVVVSQLLPSVQLTPVAGSLASLLSEIGIQPMEESRTSFDIRSGAHLSQLSLEELKKVYSNPSGNLKPDIVINAFSKKYTTLDSSNVGRLGVLLAHYCFFGDRVLQESTLKGKGKRPPLDTKTYECLISCIHSTHPYSLMNKVEFRDKIRPKVQRALVDFLKKNNKL